MKIIVSSERFKNKIREALDNKATHFEINPNDSKISFYGKTITDDYIETVKGFRESNFKGFFDMVKFYMLWMFLKELEEQPIVITFEDYTDHDIDIQLSQFVKRF